ncbi:MAG: futalosine hydrolase [Saprospiraceae bacterium]
MKILLVAATPFEIAPVLAAWEQGTTTPDNEVEVLVTGVGLTATAYALGRRLASDLPDWVLHAGVAGSLDAHYPPGSVVQVWSETFADLGVEESNGLGTDLFALNLLQADAPPFSMGRLWNNAAAEHPFLPAVHALSVNRVHGSTTSIDRLKQQYPYGQIESMEGAAVFYACLFAGVPFAQVRSISNWVEPRNRANWKLDEAITNLNVILRQML